MRERVEKRVRVLSIEKAKEREREGEKLRIFLIINKGSVRERGREKENFIA